MSCIVKGKLSREGVSNQQFEYLSEVRTDPHKDSIGRGEFSEDVERGAGVSTLRRRGRGESRCYMRQPFPKCDLKEDRELEG